MKHNRRKRKPIDEKFVTKIAIVYLCIFSSPFIISQFTPKVQTAHSSEDVPKGAENRAISFSNQTISPRKEKNCSE